MAKVLLINGSGNEHGCTFTALSEAARALNEEGVETEIIQLGKDAIRDCIGCGSCGKLGRCVFDDDQVNLVAAKAKEADGFIFGSPVYYAHPSGRVLSFLDRLFYSAGSAFAYKPGASFDVLNKYFGISNMMTVGSQYWNMVHGNKPEEVLQDLEGLQTMRTMGRNMAWMIQCIEAGKAAGITPPTGREERARTNFIR